MLALEIVLVEVVISMLGVMLIIATLFIFAIAMSRHILRRRHEKEKGNG